MLSLAQQTVRLGTFDGPFADDLGTAIADALVKERAVRFQRGDGPCDVKLECTSRAAGDRVRVRLRLIDSRGESVWAERVEGTSGDPFGLEDAVTDLAVAGVRVRSGRATGPEGPIREVYDKARARLMEVGLDGTKDCIAMLEQLDAEFPNDPWVMSLLAYALAVFGTQTGGQDERIFGRAEELAIRALDRDPTIGQTYHTIAVVRNLNGEHRNALAAARESIRRNPLEVGSHALIGEILCHVGRTAEGLQRLDLATRLDPKNPHPAREKMLALALRGDRDGALRELKRIEETGPAAGVLARMRLFAWWRDRAMAETTAELVRKYASGASWEAAVPMMEAYAKGNVAEPLANLIQAIPFRRSPWQAPRLRRHRPRRRRMLASQRPRAPARARRPRRSFPPRLPRPSPSRSAARSQP